MSNLSDLLPAGAGGKQVNFVASGTLPSGQTVALKTNGQVEAVSGGASSGVVYEAANSPYNRVVYDTANNKIVIAYQDEGNSQYLTSVVGTVSSGVITFGTPVVILSSAGVGHDSIAFDAANGKVVYEYSPANNNYYGTAIVGTVSGTSISWGTSSVFSSAGTFDISAAYDSTAQKVLIFYRGTSSYGYGIVSTVSGASISFGSASAFNSAVTTNIQAAYNSTQNKTALIYKDAGNSNYGYSIVSTVSGTSLSYGSPAQLTSDTFSATRGDASIVYDAASDKIVASWESSTGAGVGAIGTISGTSISWGTAVEIKASYSQNQNLIFNSSNNKVYSQMNFSIYELTVSGTSFTASSPNSLPSTNVSFVGAAFDSDNAVIIYAYVDGANSAYGTSSVYTPSNSADFIGITDAAISSGASGSVTIKGGISSNVTSLTPNSNYYVQADGTLTTTSSTVLAGKALSSTSINLDYTT